MFKGHRHIYYIPLLLILLAMSSMAQVVIIPDEKLEERSVNRKIIIDGHLLKLAENYVYLLDQFEFLTDDYSKYFTKCDDEAAKSYFKTIKKFNISIKQGKYFENLKIFNIDLENITNELNSIELDFDSDSKNYKFKQLFKNFAEDLDVYKDMYKAEVMVQLEEYKNIEDLQLYLVNQHYHEMSQNKYELITKIKSKEKELAELQSKLSHIEKNTQTTEIIIRIPSNLSDIYSSHTVVETLTIEIPDIDLSTFEVPEISVVPEIEGMNYDPVEIGIRSQSSRYQKSYGEFWSEKSFKDSSSSISTSTPIYLFNPTGEITVEGWDKNYVLAKSEISVASDSEIKAEKFAKHIDIQIYEKDGKLFVDTEIPRIKDTKTKIVESNIILKIPMNNKFICKSSQGLIKISKLKNDIKLKASNSEIKLDKIEGNIEVLNDNGDIEVFDITGNISLENSFGEIYVARSEGIFSIENSYNSIDLVDCTGDGKIKNIGTISITGHNGNLVIRNKKGDTDIDMHTGNLMITSAYASMTLSDIRGDVTVNNLNATIKADNIIGTLSASNSRSMISISDSKGPLSIASIKGEISLNIPGRLNGDAIITPTESSVVILFSKNSNFDFTADIEEGSIQSLIPMSISHKGNMAKANHTFGNGKYKFVIDGKESSVQIKEQ